MTNPTDEELDALEKRLKEPWYQRQSRRVEEEFDAADAITILRDQLAEANSRTDRAEAERAAQIEADAGIAEDAWLDGVPVAEISAAIRSQPHDRTALDRLLAEASEKALREAADMFDADSNIAQTILALIEAPNAQR